VTTHTGERIDMDVAPEHTAQDIIAALIQEGKLPSEDAQGNTLQFELINEGTSLMLAGDKPLVEQGVDDGAQLRIKVGARVAAARA
jgi:uncharacterized ubiquitin-like protein YukD